MNWLTKTLSSSVGQKMLMALTGLFLCIFLVIHLIGNFQLLLDDQGLQFNLYAKMMTSNPLIKTAGYITYFCILFHAFKGLHLAYKNSRSRPVKYRSYKGSANSTWMSRSMGVLGTVILVFIVIHMQQFWYQYKFGGPVGTKEYVTYLSEKDRTERQGNGAEIDSIFNAVRMQYQIYQMTGNPEAFESDPVYVQNKELLEDINYSRSTGNYKSENIKDLYSVVYFTYKTPWWVALYVISMFAICFHLLHGFASAFQSMGWNHSKYNAVIRYAGILYAVLIPAGFAAIPLIMYFKP
jgi:succinate dehydrogenase / fumarate reductase cytochrome b subunit